MFKYFNCRLIKYFGKWSSPGLILFIFRKNININGIQNQIIKVEDDHADHFFLLYIFCLDRMSYYFDLNQCTFAGLEPGITVMKNAFEEAQNTTLHLSHHHIQTSFCCSPLTPWNGPPTFLFFIFLLWKKSFLLLHR